MTAEEIFAGESDDVEFKEEIPAKSEKYMKSVVAFANGKGGRIVFGVEDGTWKVTGIKKEEIFEKMDAITSAIFDSCEPKITPSVNLQEIDDKAIIVVEILPGMQRPYYIKSQGIMDGTYVRVSRSTRHAERYSIQELILEGTNRSFDQVATDQPVTEEKISMFCNRLYQHALRLCTTEEMREQIRPLGKNQLLTWKLLTEKDGQYYPSNGYLLLDGDADAFPEAVIQCAVFKGTVRDTFITRREYAGPIYEQIEEAYQFILSHINIGSRVEGIGRQDIYELPVKTIREMISNAVCHRSYLTLGKIQVAIFDDRLEVTSPGMLDNEITIEKMKTGLSKLRNKGIAAAFAYMNVVEAWGSGIPKMFREAREYGLREPELIDMGSDFRINLYRKQPEFDSLGVVDPTKPTDQADQDTDQADQSANETDQPSERTDLSEKEKAILQIIEKNPEYTQAEMSEILGWKMNQIKYYTDKLRQKKVIERKGTSQKGYWKVC